jgi:hypothetical protein
LTTKFDTRFTLPLADAIEHVTQLQAQVAALTDIVKVQVEMSNQTTELLGRLLATASSRLDEVEDSLRQITATRMTATGVTPLGSSDRTENQPREKLGASSSSEDLPQH